MGNLNSALRGKIREISTFCIIHAFLVFITACGGGGGGGGDDANQTVELIGLTGTVSGLQGVLVLQNDGNTVEVSQDGGVSIDGSVPVGSEFEVKVVKHPVGQVCTVANGKGTAAANFGGFSVACGSAKYFTLKDRDHGFELWHTNGTADGTQLVMDLVPGVGSSVPSEPVRVGDKLFFLGFNANAELVVFVSDGSGAGTKEISKLFPVETSFYYEAFILQLGLLFDNFIVAEGGKAYFFRQLKEGEIELVETDGTEAGTRVIDSTQFVAESEYSAEALLAAVLATVNGKLVYSLYEGDGNYQLKVFDGVNMTSLDVTSSGVGQYQYFNSRLSNGTHLFFFRHFEGAASEMWITDGTKANTKKVTELERDYYWYEYFPSTFSGNYFYFAENTRNDRVQRVNLTTGETETFFDPAEPASVRAYDLFVFKSELYLLGIYDDGQENDTQEGIFKIDAQKKITQIQDSLEGFYGFALFNQVLVTDSKLYFMFYDDLESEESNNPTFTSQAESDNTGKVRLYSYDGVNDPVVLEEYGVGINFYEFGFGNLFQVGERIGFFAHSEEYGVEPYITDGSVGNASLLKDVNTATQGNYQFDLRPLANGKLNVIEEESNKFVAITSQLAEEIIFSDDTNAYIVSNEPVIVGDRSFFVFSEMLEQERHQGIFVTDGTAAGTSKLNIAADSAESSLDEIIDIHVYNGELFARIREANNYQNLLRISFDQADASLVRLSKVFTNPEFRIDGVLPLDGTGIVLYGAEDDLGYIKLLSGANLESTTYTLTINEGRFYSPSSLKLIGDELYFWAADSSTISGEVFKFNLLTKQIEKVTSGFDANLYAYKNVFQVGAELVVHLYSDFYLVGENGEVSLIFSSYRSEEKVTYVNDTIFVTRLENVEGQPDDIELWKYTEGNLQLVKDIYDGEQGSDPRNLLVLGDKVLFAAVSQKEGYELWVTDGTEAGTQILKNIKPGVFGSMPYYLTTLDGITAYFIADDHVHGYEVWKTDGTEAGTFLLNDTNKDSAGSWYSLFDLCFLGGANVSGSSSGRVKPSC